MTSKIMWLPYFPRAFLKDGVCPQKAQANAQRKLKSNPESGLPQNPSPCAPKAAYPERTEATFFEEPFHRRGWLPRKGLPITRSLFTGKKWTAAVGGIVLWLMLKHHRYGPGLRGCSLPLVSSFFLAQAAQSYFASLSFVPQRDPFGLATPHGKIHDCSPRDQDSFDGCVSFRVS